MNIKSTDIGLIVERAICEQDAKYMNIHKDGSITWDMSEDSTSFKSYYLPQLREASECALEKKLVKSVEEGIDRRLWPLKRSLLREEELVVTYSNECLRRI